MFNRFPELRNIPEGTPPNDGFLDGLFFLGEMCALVYVLPVLSFALFLPGLPYAAKLTSALALLICVGVPMVWAVLVPGGLWYMLLPILAPAGLVCFLIYMSSRSRIALQRSENAIPTDSN